MIMITKNNDNNDFHDDRNNYSTQQTPQLSIMLSASKHDNLISPAGLAVV